LFIITSNDHTPLFLVTSSFFFHFILLPFFLLYL
jgi:hypothetical protein